MTGTDQPKMELNSKKAYLFLVTGAFGIFLFVYLVEIPQSRFTYMFEPPQNEPLVPPSSIDVPLLPPNTSSVDPTPPVLPPVPLEEEPKPLNFVDSLSTFDWTGFSAVVNATTKDVAKIEVFQEELMYRLTPFLELEPHVPIDTSCVPPTLGNSSELECTGHGTVFTGGHRPAGGIVPKIGILVQFGFGVDVLEVYLNEVYDTVDQFFIIESTKAHFRTLRKSLMWEKVKEQERFRKFRDKITHFVIDDGEAAGANEIYGNKTKLANNIWKMEGLQESLRWTKFLQWNDAHKFFTEQDLIGFGDADEIPSRAMLHRLKHCELNGPQFDFGIWFPFGHIDQAFKTDFPVPGHPYTLGDPTFWTLKSALDHAQKKKVPNRMRGTSGHYVLGGIHMTHYGYLPYKLMRDISCTECGPSVSELLDFDSSLKSGQIRDLELRRGATPIQNMDRVVKLVTIAEQMKDIAILPWFYNCNRDRYPVWERGHDTRLD